MSATVNDVMTTRVAAVRKNAPFKDIAGAGAAHVAPGSVAGEDEPARPADDPIAA